MNKIKLFHTLLFFYTAVFGQKLQESKLNLDTNLGTKFS
ncbi:hypothetical protein LCGC14_1128370 [marine sediment metagenome]|uniref:Uncharacterized protein n=1 Tax=marine sediment metagenome TaxID=412755 RepID=A0A0F9MPN3_9ZZZZ